MESKALYRTFIAIPVEVPQVLKETLADLEKKFAGERIRWIDPGQMHITLRFMGDLPEGAVSAIGLRFQSAYSAFTPAVFRLRGLRTFSHRSALKVLWAGVGEEGVFYDLHAATVGLLDGIVPVDDNSGFRPHLTVARMKQLREPVRLRNEIARFRNKDFGTSALKRVVFYRSVLRPSGAVYEVLRTAELE
ncbi:MAG: RNA 2',3'-cyclic phosphodiesterase [Bacteroidales bacterium]|nr:RNA 2',3'-cyclic phosphodiesterase [Bacteroidales bacterium]MDT8430808.1 RNA 2',3'-cyclic phosphodiesterase [Bacteroidales bacterium]